MRRRLIFNTGAFLLYLGGSVSVRAGGLVYFDIDHISDGLQGGNTVWSNPNWFDGITWNGWNNAAQNVAVLSAIPGGTLTLGANTTAGGLQIEMPGFTIAAASSFALTLSNGAVWVADGVSAAVTASLITTTGVGLHKTGGGLLAIGSTNTIASNITIEGGILSIAADLALGSSANDITFTGGGKLRYTGGAEYVIPAGRLLTIGTGGGGFDATTANVRVGGLGQITGAGMLNKSGSKSLVISAANAGFSGSVTVAEGTLQLVDGAAVGGRPITLGGGKLTLAADIPTSFASNIAITADSIITVDSVSTSGAVLGAHSLGALDLGAGSTLEVIGANSRWLSAASVQANGPIKLTLSGLEVRGALTGAGGVRIGAINAPVESLRVGLIFTGGGTRTFGNPLAAEDAVAGKVILASSATQVTYNGSWQGGGTAQESYAVIRDGGSFTLGADAHLNLVTADLANLRTLHAWGNGTSNTFEISAGFVADRTLAATVAEGLGAVEIKDATLLTRASAGLPVVTKLDGQGQAHRAGLLTFIGTGASRWQMASAAQSYDGGVRFDASATVETQVDLAHTGTVQQKWDGQWQVPTAGVTLTKIGVAWLTLDTQGYIAGTSLNVNEGGVRFAGDPGAGWFAGNYARGANAAITTPPVAARTLALNVGSAAAPATVEFAAPLDQLASIALGAGGVARITDSPVVGAKIVVTSALSIAAGGLMDLRNNRLVVNYDAQATSPLNALEAMILRGRNGGAPGTLWQGDGITSGTAGAAGGSLAVGIVEATEIMNLTGNQTSPWGGATVDASSVLLRLTLAGDSDLDGAVNLNDLIHLANHYGATTNEHWSGGDFDYDGAVTLNDLIILANNYGSTLAGAPPVGAEAFAADWAGVWEGASVPEPGLGWVLGLLAASVGRRRRR